MGLYETGMVRLGFIDPVDIRRRSGAGWLTIIQLHRRAPALLLDALRRVDSLPDAVHAAVVAFGRGEGMGIICQLVGKTESLLGWSPPSSAARV